MHPARTGKTAMRPSGGSLLGRRRSWQGVVVWVHDYFYGAQADQFTFYRVPTVLFTDEQYKNISPEAKILYGILLKRMELSARNGWVDAKGRVFIIFTLEEIMRKLNCADNKATRLMDELEEKCGLIERKRQGQGKPNLIYVKNFIEKQDIPGKPDPGSRFLIRENHDSGFAKTTIPDSLKPRTSNTEYRDTDNSDTENRIDQGCDAIDEYHRYEKYFRAARKNEGLTVYRHKRR